MTRDEAGYFLRQLRSARATAYRDSEGFHAIFHALERLGFFLTDNAAGLGQFRNAIEHVADRSPLAQQIPAIHAEVHPSFSNLYELVRQGRNQAVHEGAYARHLTQHATELALIVEDALMEVCMVAQDFMVRDPVIAELWQPISFIRQKMLINSFSFLPVRAARGWCFISDRDVALYLRALQPDGQRATRLGNTLQEAIKDGVKLNGAETCAGDTPIRELAEEITDSPILVVRESDNHELLGIITAFDVM